MAFPLGYESGMAFPWTRGNKSTKRDVLLRHKSISELVNEHFPDAQPTVHDELFQRAPQRSAPDHLEALLSLQTLEASLALVLRAAGMIAWDWDLRTDEVNWSGDAKRFYGVPPEMPFDFARDSFALLHPEDKEKALGDLGDVLSGKQDYRIEFRTIRPDNGEVMWAEARAEVLRNENGDPIRAYGVTIDITERKKNALIHTERLRALADASVRITGAVDFCSTINEVTKAAREIIGAAVAITRTSINGDDSENITTIDPLSSGVNDCEDKQKKSVQLDVETLIGFIGETKNSIRLNGAESRRHPLSKVVKSVGQRGVLAALLVGKNRKRMGYILLVDKLDEDAFHEDDESVLIQLAELASGAIENAQAQSAAVKALKESQVARTEAESANRAKDDFLAILSHELRSPLNAMLGWVTILKHQGIEQPMVLRAVETIEKNITVQAQIIDDLLDVSRIISGKMQLNKARLDLNALIASSIQSLQPIAEAHGIIISYYPAPSRVEVYGDAQRLQQLVTNLLNNSIKFTDRGGSIVVSTALVDAAAKIEVRDTGCGIEPELLPHIFDRFRQADSSTTRKHGGLGLGLAIVKLLSELHDGSVSAGSEGPGKGSLFSVTLPRLPLKEFKGEVVPVPQQSNDVRGVPQRTVLIVEDDDDSRDALTLFLKRTGARVRAVATVRDAITAVKQEIPNVLISDIGMPDADGYSLIREIMKGDAPELRQMVKIAITGFASTQDHDKALRIGFDDHIGKPISPEKLTARIDAILEARKKALACPAMPGAGKTSRECES